MPELKVMESPVAVQAERPLCVDLDGTLVKSDTFVDSLMVLARRDPIAFLQTSQWVLKGKAYFKSQVASRVTLDAAHLPYNRPLLEYLRNEHASGRKLYLATGADSVLAQKIADHLGIFEDVMASDGRLNLTGDNKLHLLEHRFRADGFDYIGNAMPDVPILQGAQQAMLANPVSGLKNALNRRNVTVSRTFQDRSSWPAALTKALRVHQWAEDLLYFCPCCWATPSCGPLAACAAFFCFCFTASATYISTTCSTWSRIGYTSTNAERAFASGDLSVARRLQHLAFDVGTCPGRPQPGCHRNVSAFICCCYLVTTLAYSLSLKRSCWWMSSSSPGLYTIRMMAGFAATHDPVSPWLGAFSIFLFS